MDKLTPRQTEILELIKEFTATTGYPPTRAEIARRLGFRSANAAEDHLRALARKGAIQLVPGSSRGIRLPEEEGLPVVGRVAAGSPLLAEQHIDHHCRLSPDLFTPRADYLLKVRGMSMREAGILDGDLLAVHKAGEARNGQIVVARLQDEVTVKRFQRHGHKVLLLPENPEFQPIEVDLRREPVVIEGIGVGIIRMGQIL
jgi:repressor LexA